MPSSLQLIHGNAFVPGSVSAGWEQDTSNALLTASRGLVNLFGHFHSLGPTNAAPRGSSP